jgi:hypothetical protein
VPDGITVGGTVRDSWRQTLAGAHFLAEGRPAYGRANFDLLRKRVLLAN